MAVGATVGAIAAATACFAITYNSQEVRNYDETKREVRYEPSQGAVAQIREFEVAPGVVAPGSRVTFAASYYIMAADAAQDIALTETRVVTAIGASGQRKELGRHTNRLTVKPGTRRGDGEFEVKSGVAEGSYEIAFEIDASGQRDSKTLPLSVTKNQALLRDPTRRVARVTAELPAKPETAGATENTARNDAPGAAAGSAPDAPRSDDARQTASGPSVTTTPLASLGEPNPTAPPTMTTGVPMVASVASATEASKATRHRFFLASKAVGAGSLRDGPGSGFKIVGQIQNGERFPLLDVVAPHGSAVTWYKLRLDDGREAWVSSAVGHEVDD
jgi:hypothetical protein